jgi:hypothetical protein
VLGLTVIETAFALRITDVGAALGANQLTVIDGTGAFTFGFETNYTFEFSHGCFVNLPWNFASF